MMILPEPAHKFGYTHEQVAELFGERAEEFYDWMKGQTMMLDDELGPIFYAWDVEWYIAGLPIID